MNDRSENQQGSQPVSTPSRDDEQAKQKAATDKKVISGCAFAGGATFFLLNITTGVVPGGAAGGAIGGVLGAVLGFIIINSLRK